MRHAFMALFVSLIQYLAALTAQAVMNPAMTYRAKAENPSCYKASR